MVMKLDLEECEATPTNQIPGFAERIKALMPSLYEHRCSLKEAGGFFERIERGTWLGHVIEHVALEIQSLAGMNCGFGRTRCARPKGVYHVVFAYELEKAGIYAAHAAVRIVQALKDNIEYDLEGDISELKRIRNRDGIGPSTQSILNAAKKLGIPFKRLDNASMFLLGQGVNQKILQATIAATTSGIAIDLASDKEKTKTILSQNYVPVPEGRSVFDKEELGEAIQAIGFPLVIKPVNGNQGRGITTNINNEEQALMAFELAQKISSEVIVERFIRGYDFRFLVINYKLEAVATRTPAMVRGDGYSTIQQLIDETNKDPNRGEGHERILTKIEVDGNTTAILKGKNLTLSSVLAEGEILLLKDTANLSTGGTARDCTDIVHPHNIFLAERIARLMDLNICGIDVVAEDITQPITSENGAILEVNAAPGFRMHLCPQKGQARNVGLPVIRMLYPDGAASRIPIVAVTGTNGKTTTTRLIAHLAKSAGNTVGYTTTDGIYIQDQMIHHGDCSGPGSAEVVLRDPMVDFAVLECARGGILRSGLGFDKCNISIITNITEDHLGLNGIDSLEELAKVKSVVARSTFANGFAILNADDDLVYNIKNELDCTVALFSTGEKNSRVLDHCSGGGWAATIEKGYFVIHHGEWKLRVARVNEVPLTLEGRAGIMIKNILPAILAAALSEFDMQVIRKALQSFIPGPELTPGRMNIFKVRDFEVMIDYVHNTDGFSHLRDFMSQVKAYKKTGIIAGTGDRRDVDLRKIGEYAAQTFDEIIIRHDKDGRGRSNENITELLTEGIRIKRPEMNITIISDELEALSHAIESADTGSFIVLASDEIQKSINFVRSQQQARVPRELQY